MTTVHRATQNHIFLHYVFFIQIASSELGYELEFLLIFLDNKM